jgi:ABC-2 type transport system ATP-binding protein
VSEPVIVTRALSRRFGELVAVKDVSLEVEKGEIFGVLGPNGAGKSTTIRMLCGILDPTSGEGTVVGYDIRREAERVKERIGYIRKRVGEVLERTGLVERRRQIAGTLSGGWKQRVALASATIHEPPLLFLDEPTAGVDPVSRREFWEQIHRLAHEGTTVLLTTHYMDEAERCHRLAFIFRGSVLDVGTPEAIVARRRLRGVELESDHALAAAEALRHDPAVDEVAHYGNVLRLVTRDDTDPAAVIARVLVGELAPRVVRPTRVGVEDAFVSMVRTDEAPAALKAAS